MKSHIKLVIVTIAVLFVITGTGVTWRIYSQRLHLNQQAPLLLPPVTMWPSNILAAAEILRTSDVSRARDKAGYEIDRYIMDCRFPRDPTDKSQWQTLHEETILKVLGPPNFGPINNFGYLSYNLGHYSGSHQALEFLMSSGVVTKVIISHWDGPPCTIHDHTNDNIERNQDAEQAGPGYPPQGVGSPDP